MLGSFFGIADYGAFVIAFVLLLLLPGPGNLALITSAGKGGLAGGVASVFGLLLGDQILLWLTVAGVAAVLSAISPTRYSVSHSTECRKSTSRSALQPAVPR